jgi:drug/metabolite transporter (DMT)-like permease
MRDTPLTGTDVLWLLGFPSPMSVGQLLFRCGALGIAGKPFQVIVALLLTMPAFYAAVLLYGACTLLWVWLLGRYSLSLAHPIAALAVVVLSLLDTLCFQQPLSGTYWLGPFIILSGTLLIVLVQRSM